MNNTLVRTIVRTRLRRTYDAVEGDDEVDALRAFTKPEVEDEGAAEELLALEEVLGAAATGTLADVVAGADTCERHSVAAGRGSLTVLSRFMFLP